MPDHYGYENWYEEESADSTIKNEDELYDFPPMSLLEEEGLKIFTPNKLLTRLIISTNKSWQ